MLIVAGDGEHSFEGATGAFHDVGGDGDLEDFLAQ